MALKGKSGSGSRVTNRLVALSSAAVLAVYSAGYLRTRAAAEEIEAADRSRRPTAPPFMAAATLAKPAAPVTPVVPASPRPKKIRKARGTGPQPASPAAAASGAAPVPSAGWIAPAAPVTSPAVVADPPAQPVTPAMPVYKDGTYSGWGTSRHGDIEAMVVIAGGRIASAVISQCLTRYSCSWVAHLQGQVVERQSPEVDYVSGATQSTNAFYYAVVQALAKAK